MSKTTTLDQDSLALDAWLIRHSKEDIESVNQARKNGKPSPRFYLLDEEAKEASIRITAEFGVSDEDTLSRMVNEYSSDGFTGEVVGRTGLDFLTTAKNFAEENPGNFDSLHELRIDRTVARVRKFEELSNNYKLRAAWIKRYGHEAFQNIHRKYLQQERARILAEQEKTATEQRVAEDKKESERGLMYKSPYM